MSYFGLFDTPQIGQTEIAKKHNITKQAVQCRIDRCMARMKRECKTKKFKDLKDFLNGNN